MAVPDHLLKPSLTDDRIKGAMYSETAHFIVSFLGGIWSCLLFSYWSVRRVGMQNDYRMLYGLSCTVAFVICFLIFSCGMIGKPEMGVQLDFLPVLEMRTVRLLNRVFGIVMCVVLIRIQRSVFRMSEFSDEETPRPWVAGIVAILLGSALNLGLWGVVWVVIR